jgi:hypothetical protein
VRVHCSELADDVWLLGKLTQPLSGPGYVGLVNLGNSCYVSSLLQAAIPRASCASFILHLASCTLRFASCILHCMRSVLISLLLAADYERHVVVVTASACSSVRAPLHASCAGALSARCAVVTPVDGYDISRTVAAVHCRMLTAVPAV